MGPGARLRGGRGHDPRRPGHRLGHQEVAGRPRGGPGDLDITDPRLSQVSLTYHDINPDRGLFHLLRRRGDVSTLVDDDAVRAAVAAPPATTRAALRGRFLRRARETGTDVTVDWSRLKVNGEHGGELLLGDPFAATDPGSTTSSR